MGGMTRLLLLLWAGVTVGSLVDLQKRIIGGHNCLDTERGYHVILRFTDVKTKETFICSGSLISKEWILTAAHCDKGGPITAVLGRNPMSANRLEIEGTPRSFLDTKDKQGKTITHDIMLLKLKKNTTTIPVLRPDCKKKPNIGEEVQIAGYLSYAGPGENKTEHHINTSVPIQCATTKVEKCDAGYSCLQKYPHVFCYQDEYVDATGGDSGGGVVVKDKDDKAMLYGVHVSSDRIACGRSAAAIDICTDIYMKWIEETPELDWP